MLPLFALIIGLQRFSNSSSFLQVAQNAAWCVMPILLKEHAPPQCGACFPGTVYQLGNLLSAPVANIQDLRPGWVFEITTPKANIDLTILFQAFVICGADYSALCQRRVPDSEENG